ncbi:MAG: hypothetical protein AB7H97_15165 [Pseudobdellovibrionaceae bacterium]
MRLLFTVTLLPVLISIQSYANPVQFAGDLKSTSQNIKTWIQNEFGVSTCGSLAKDFYSPLYTHLFTGTPQARFSEAQLTGLDAKDPKNSLVTLFEARMLLRDKFLRMTAEEQFANRQEFQSCANQVRAAMRTIRSWEEQFSLYWAKKNNQTAEVKNKEDLSRYDLKWPTWMVHPDWRGKFKGIESIQAGDILLSRGDAFTSAVISRIGSVDNQFSHLAMVTEENGRKYVLESELNGGLQMVTLESYLSVTKSRWVILRMKNIGSGDSTPASQVAKLAAAWLADQARPGVTDPRKKIPYNFGMDMLDRTQMFCSQAISFAIEAACSMPGIRCNSVNKYVNPKILPFPLSYTSFNLDQNPLIKMLQIKVTETFAPADVEEEPSLELIAEYKNLAQIEEARMFDMILTKMFLWMEKEGYTFADSAVIIGASEVADVIVKKMGKMPENQPKSFTQGSIILYFLMMHTGPGSQLADLVNQINYKLLGEKLGQLVKSGALTKAQADEITKKAPAVAERLSRHVGFVTHLKRFSIAYEKHFKQPFSEYDMDLALEEIRVEDCARVQSGQPALFHDIFGKKFDGDVQTRCSTEKLNWSDF